MFGYISVNKAELKVKEYETYKALYCGLCRHLGKTYGALAKSVLNYDLTFVSLMSAALSEEIPCYERKCCRANPFKKCNYCKDDDEAQSLAAAATVALFDLKAEDNVRDGGFFEKLGFGFIRLFSKAWAKKAYKLQPELKPIIEEYRNGQCIAEADPECGIDKAAEPTAKAVSGILSLLECDEKYKFVLERMGYCLGKWIYLCDAADDIKKDIKKGTFNPLVKDVKGAENIKAAVRERTEPIMNNCWTECAKYSELLEFGKFKSIIDNILYEGLQKQQSKIFEKEQK